MPTTATGGDPLEAYHAHPAESSTMLKKPHTGTMLDFWAAYRDPDRTPFVPTDPMRQGALTDCIITTPDRFALLYVVLPSDMPRRPTAKQLTDGQSSKAGTKAHDAWRDAQDREAAWQEFEVATRGRQVISQAWLDTAECIRDALLSDPDIGPRIRDARSESQTPFFWTDSEGRECRYLPDLLTQAGGMLDYKKARSSAPRQAGAQAYQLAYDVQLDHYSEGATVQNDAAPTEVGLITYEWEWPHNCSLLLATPEFMAMGAERRAQSRLLIAECDASGIYPTHGVAPLDVPAWRKDGTAQPPATPLELF